MFENHDARCASPACPTTFDWRLEGKFFRFPLDQVFGPAGLGPSGELARNLHKVEHFWLCESCARVFTLVYEPGRGIVPRLLRPDPEAAAKSEERLTAAC